MPVIDHIDGENRDIYLHADTITTSVHPIDIYKEMRALRRTNESLRNFDVFLVAKGKDFKGQNAEGNDEFTERYVICTVGTRIIPYDVSHTLTITGTIITDDGQSGVNCFDRSPLNPATLVDINYVPKQVEVIEVATGSGLTTEEHDKLLGLPQADVIAMEVLNNTLIGAGITLSEANEIILATLVGKISGANTTSVTIRDLNDTKDIVQATVDQYGNRTAIAVTL